MTDAIHSERKSDLSTNKPLRVLVIEDSEPDALLLLRQLRQGGYKPQSQRVETAAALTAALAAQEWDVIIADYRLPQFTGFDALKLVQACGRDMPFVLVSGAIGEEQAVAMMKAGAHGFLLKDRLAQLAPVVERELDAAEVRRQRRLAEEQIRILNRELESRVVERTSELQAAVDALKTEIVERQRLEREVLKISEREQSRIGQDLHDGACQNLACIAVLAQVAARDLDREKSPTADKVREISELARQSMDEVRRLAAGLFPVKIEQNGLEWALKELADEISARSKSKCRFIMHQPIAFTDQNAAVQLYRIAQEAVSNAMRHGCAPNITVELAARDGTVSLTICDDGTGMPPGPKKGGLGLHTMRYRAKMLGGSLEVGPAAGSGTVVTCSFSC